MSGTSGARDRHVLQKWNACAFAQQMLADEDLCGVRTAGATAACSPPGLAGSQGLVRDGEDPGRRARWPPDPTPRDNPLLVGNGRDREPTDEETAMFPWATGGGGRRRPRWPDLPRPTCRPAGGHHALSPDSPRGGPETVPERGVWPVGMRPGEGPFWVPFGAPERHARRAHWRHFQDACEQGRLGRPETVRRRSGWSRGRGRSVAEAGGAATADRRAVRRRRPEAFRRGRIVCWTPPRGGFRSATREVRDGGVILSDDARVITKAYTGGSRGARAGGRPAGGPEAAGARSWPKRVFRSPNRAYFDSVPQPPQLPGVLGHGLGHSGRPL